MQQVTETLPSVMLHLLHVIRSAVSFWCVHLSPLKVVVQGPILLAEALQKIREMELRPANTYTALQNLLPLPFIFISMSRTWHPAGGCPEDCYIPYVMCPIPSGSLSMCGGTPRGQCMTSSGQCTCNTGYSGVDCGSCALGYSREGVRCVLEGEGHPGQALLAKHFWQCPYGNAL